MFRKNSKKEELVFYLFFIILPLAFFSYFLYSNKLIGFIDAFYQFFPYRYFLANSVLKGDLPLWWPYTALGYPFIETLQSAVFYPLNYLFVFLYKDNPFLAYNLGIIFHTILLLIVSYRYYLFLLGNRYVSFISSILFSLGGTAIIYSDYANFHASIIYLLLCLYNLHLIIYKFENNKDIKINILTYSLSFGLLVLVGHPNMIVYTLLYSFVYVLVLLFIKKELFFKVLFYWSISLFLSFLIWGLQFVIFKDYDSVRKLIAKEAFNLGSYDLNLFLSYLLPFIYNKNYIIYLTTENQIVYFEIIHYIFVLSIFSLIYFYYNFFANIKEKKNYYNKYVYILILSILSFLLSLGKYTIFHYIAMFFPGYADVRLHWRNLILFDFTLAFSLGFMLKDLLFNPKYFVNILKKVLRIFLFFIVGIVLISFIFVYFTYQENLVNLVDFNYKSFLNDLPFIIISILFCILGLVILKNRKIFKRYFYLVLGILLMLILTNNIFYYYTIYKQQPYKSTTINFSNYLFVYRSIVNNIKENSNFWIAFKHFKDNIVQPYNINVIAINSNKIFFDYYDPFLSFEKWYLLEKNLSNIFFFYRFNYILSLFGFKYLFHYNSFYSDFDKIVINNLYNIKSIEINKYKLNNIFMVPVYKRNSKNELIEQAQINNNKITLSNDNPIIFYLPYFKEYNNLCLGLKIKKTKKENNFNKFYSSLIDIPNDIYLAIETKDNNLIGLGNFYTFFVPYEEYRYIMIPFSLVALTTLKHNLDNFIYTFNNQKFLRFAIGSNAIIEYEIEEIDIYYYPDYYNPGVYDNKEYLTYEKIVTNRVPLASGRTFETSIYKNNNSMEIIDSVVKLGISKDIFELKKDILLINFNFKQEAKIYPEYIQKLKEYLNNINKLKYQNNYANITENNISNLNFVRSKITDKEIFKKNNEISFRVKTEGDSFIVINHSYYKYWKGYIDNIEVPVLKVNGIVMGIIVPKGEHKVVLKFEPWYAKFFFVPFFVITIYFIIIMILLNRKN
jgi:hypothetical protein